MINTSVKQRPQLAPCFTISQKRRVVRCQTSTSTSQRRKRLKHLRSTKPTTSWDVGNKWKDQDGTKVLQSHSQVTIPIALKIQTPRLGLGAHSTLLPKTSVITTTGISHSSRTPTESRLSLYLRIVHGTVVRRRHSRDAELSCTSSSRLQLATKVN